MATQKRIVWGRAVIRLTTKGSGRHARYIADVSVDGQPVGEPVFGVSKPTVIEEAKALATSHGAYSRRSSADSRTGVPVFKARQYATMTVAIERPDGIEEYKTWRGSSAKSIRRAAKAAYPGCKLRFGKILYHVR